MNDEGQIRVVPSTFIAPGASQAIRIKSCRTRMIDLSCDFARLSRTAPRSLRIDGRITTCSIAAAFYQGLIDCDSPSRTSPLSAYLQAEGPKRIPAFVFERLFSHRMRLNHEVAGNWYVCEPGDAKAPSIWFKLMSAAGWSALDDAFALSLMSHDIPAWKAWFEGTQLWLSPVSSASVVISATDFLSLNPCDMDIGGGRVRHMLTKGEVPENALRLLTQAGNRDMDDLIRSRIFINCFLELTGGHPFDVDAICRRDDLIFVAEFKRKYPSHDGFFGMDKHLIKLPRQLDGICPLYHFVLEDLRGKAAKGSDPTTALLDACNEGPGFRWHVLHLEPGFERKFPGRLQTYGNDSGQRGGKREQTAIPIEAFTPIHADLIIDMTITSNHTL